LLCAGPECTISDCCIIPFSCGIYECPFNTSARSWPNNINCTNEICATAEFQEECCYFDIPNVTNASEAINATNATTLPDATNFTNTTNFSNTSLADEGSTTEMMIAAACPGFICPVDMLPRLQQANNSSNVTAAAATGVLEFAKTLP
jgi:hypothetical protein